jgi:hypothetical protein
MKTDLAVVAGTTATVVSSIFAIVVLNVSKKPQSTTTAVNSSTTTVYTKETKDGYLIYDEKSTDDYVAKGKEITFLKPTGKYKIEIYIAEPGTTTLTRIRIQEGNTYTDPGMLFRINTMRNDYYYDVNNEGSVIQYKSSRNDACPIIAITPYSMISIDIAIASITQYNYLVYVQKNDDSFILNADSITFKQTGKYKITFTNIIGPTKLNIFVSNQSPISLDIIYGTTGLVRNIIADSIMKIQTVGTLDSIPNMKIEYFKLSP